MEVAAVRYLISDGSVIGTWRGENTIPTNVDPNTDILEITITQYEELATKGLTYGNQYRWEVQGGTTLVERTDNRPRIRFVPTSVEVAVGAAAVPVTVTRIDDGGVVIPTNGTFKIRILGKPVNLTLVNGIGTLNVPTGRTREVTVGDGQNYRVEAPLEVRVFSTDIDL